MALNVITADFETYFSTKDKYGLRTLTTQEYIQHPSFQVIGVSLASEDGDVVWHHGAQVAPALAAIDWSTTVFCAHNTRFDAAILNWVYGHKPAHLMCTMSMAASSGAAILAGASLAGMADLLRKAGHDLPAKGDEVLRADGKRYEDFSEWELATYGEYCRTDTAICRYLMRELTVLTPKQELWWQSMVLKAYTDPKLLLDKDMLIQELVRVQTLKNETLDKAAAAHNCTPLQFRALLMSNNKFADVLRSVGVEPPMKTSLTTGKQTYAFAKTDEGMQELAEHEDEVVTTYIAARLGNKSTIQETRLERLIGLADKGPLPMPYKISGAHTHRLSGDEKINVQNWPSGRVAGQSNMMRRALTAPPGYVICAADSAQVELRTGATVVNDPTLLGVFAAGTDPYSVFAEAMYNVPAADIRAGAKAGDPDGVRMRAAGKAGLLGCIYGAGVNGYIGYCENVAKIAMDEAEATRTVGTFRSTMQAFPAFWRQCDNVLRAMIRGQSGRFGGADGQMFFYDGARELFGRRIPGVQLPDGLWISYLNLREKYTPDRGNQIVYDDTRRGKVIKSETIYGSKMFENLNQAVAFSALKFQLIRMDAKYTTLGNVHDEGIHLVPEAEAEQAKLVAEQVYAQVPAWLEGCPLKGEAGVAFRYGDC